MGKYSHFTFGTSFCVSRMGITSPVLQVRKLRVRDVSPNITQSTRTPAGFRAVTPMILEASRLQDAQVKGLAMKVEPGGRC